MSGPPSIADVLDQWLNSSSVSREDLERALVAREEAMAEFLRLAGIQFGMYPQIVAEVLAEAGLGEPISTAQREFIRAQFVVLMDAIAAAQRGEGPMPNP